MKPNGFPFGFRVVGPATEPRRLVGGVVMRIRLPTGHRWAKLNDIAGTLVAVRRTKATVDYSELGKVNIALDNLLPAAEHDRQGYWVSFGGANR